MQDDLPMNKALNGLPIRTGGYLWKALAAALLMPAMGLSGVVVYGRWHRWQPPPPPPPVRPVAVLDKPIFAPSAAGNGLLLTAGPAASGHISLAGVVKFRIVLPPQVGGGAIALSQRVGSQPAQPLTSRQWVTAQPQTRVMISWVPLPRAGKAAHAMPAATLRVGRAGSLHISATTGITSESRAAAKARAGLEQMVIDAQLQGKRMDRIQFLAKAPPTKALLLTPYTPENLPLHIPARFNCNGRPPATLCLAVDSGRVDGGGRVVTAGDGKWATVLVGSNWSSASGKLVPVSSEWERENGSRYYRARSSAVNFFLQPLVLANDYASPADWQDYNYSSDSLVPANAKQLKKLAVQARVKLLRPLRSVTLRVELYPGGPVLEKVIYQRRLPAPPAATQPVKNPAAPKPTQ